MEKNIQVKCIKDVVMKNSGVIAFIEGCTYNAVQEEDGSIRAENEQGNQRHWISSSSGDFSKWFLDYFEVAHKLDSYVNKLLREEKELLEKRIENMQLTIEQRKQYLQEDEKFLELMKLDLEEVAKALV